jgi:AraC-like DNA-binding protein
MNGATAADFYERFVVDEIPNMYAESPRRAVMKAASEIGTLKVDALAGRFFTASKIDLHLKYNTIIEAKDNLIDKIGFYMLDCGRGGAAAFGETNFSLSRHVSGGESYMAFSPSLPELHRFDAQTTKPLYLEVTADYFASLLDSGDPFTGSLKEKILKREFFGMKSTLMPAQYRLATAMCECPLEGALGNLMMEGTLQQFIAMQLTPFVQPTQRRENITTRDRDIIYGVRDHLHRTFRDNHSLLDLSKQFGINQNKLKKSFKEVFGIPVIEYLYNLKMEHARNLLYDQGMYVGEVAAVVGYKNANHFATAFKRKFGMKPSRVAENLKRY